MSIKENIDKTDSIAAAPGSIRLSQIYKSYGSKQVFSGFSCSFPLGETTCITGASGCGKTTLLNIMMGITQPDSGSIFGIDGKRLSAVFQEDRLCMNLSASANIRLVNEGLSRREAGEMLLAMGLEDDSQPVSEHSGGMKRRVAILRALAADYDILFLDEPFRGLDQRTKEVSLAYFREKTLNKTLLCVTHDRQEAELLSTAPILELQPQ